VWPNSLGSLAIVAQQDLEPSADSFLHNQDKTTDDTVEAAIEKC
jgi:hypothetical protein